MITYFCVNSRTSRKTVKAVGGTGSANTLNDYEEGTWTPEVTAATTHQQSYDWFWSLHKIGNQVIAFGIVNNINITSAAGNARIQGLPFSLSNKY